MMAMMQAALMMLVAVSWYTNLTGLTEDDVNSTIHLSTVDPLLCPRTTNFRGTEKRKEEITIRGKL